MVALNQLLGESFSRSRDWVEGTGLNGSVNVADFILKLPSNKIPEGKRRIRGGVIVTVGDALELLNDQVHLSPIREGLSINGSIFKVGLSGGLNPVGVVLDESGHFLWERNTVGNVDGGGLRGVVERQSECEPSVVDVGAQKITL